ncbi:trypsin, partial [Enterobacter hormaechei]|nr:trypsin [Enterobacter hormaechei]
DKRYLRYSACNITGKASLVYEGIWAWSPAAAVNCAGVAGGTSGSPVMLKDQSKIIGVLNTTVDRSYWGCGLNRPCEFIIDHSFSRTGASYYMPIDKIARAFTSDGKLDLSKFDDGKGITINTSGPLITKGTVNNKP